MIEGIVRVMEEFITNYTKCNNEECKKSTKEMAIAMMSGYIEDDIELRLYDIFIRILDIL